MEKKVVYIAGLGLIGASLALGIKRAHPNVTILGYNRSEASRTIALERGMVDQVTDDFAAFAPLADIIILALPIKQTKSYLETLAGLNLKDQVLVTDAGSTKAEIVAQAEKVFTDKDVRFVGGGIPWPVVIRQVLQQQMQPYLRTLIIFLPLPA